jgi:hypothetical protein
MAYSKDWWVEAWTLPGVGSFQRKVAKVEAISASVGDGVTTKGSGSIEVRAQYDRLDEICDPKNNVESLLRLYVDGNVVSEFYARTLSFPYGESGNKVIKISGPGLADALDHAIVFPYDYPKAPTRDPDWIFGSEENAMGNAGAEDYGESGLQNPGAETGTIVPWFTTSAALIADQTFVRTGSWSFRVTSDIEEGGASQIFSVLPGAQYTVTGYVFGVAGDKVQMGLTTDPDGQPKFTYTRFNVVDPETEWPTETEVQLDHTIAVTNTWEQVQLTLITGRQQTRMKLSFRGLNVSQPQVFRFDDVDANGPSLGAEPWIFSHPSDLASTTFEATSEQARTDTHSLKLTCKQQQYVYQRITGITPGATYTATAYLRNSIGDVWEFVLMDPMGNILARDQHTLPVNSWDKYEIVTTLPDTIYGNNQDVPPDTEVWLGIRYVSPNVTSTVYIDDVSFAPGLPGTTFGDIMTQLMDDAAVDHIADGRTSAGGAGHLAWIKYDSWSNSLDSAGNTWNDASLSVEISRGQTYLQFLEQIARKFGYEWRLAWNGSQHELKLYNPYDPATKTGGMGTDLTATVGIVEGQPESGDIIKSNRGSSAVFGEGAEGLYDEQTDAGLISAYGRRERYVGLKEALALSTVQSLTTEELSKESVDSAELKLTFWGGQDVLPYTDFNIGDTVRMVLKESEQIGDEHRAVQFSVRLTEEVRVDVDFGGIVYHRPVWSGPLPVARGGGGASSGLTEVVSRLHRAFKSPFERERPKLSNSTPVLFDPSSSPPTVFVAASDSSQLDKNRADFVCDGTDDHDEINAAILSGIEGLSGLVAPRIFLAEGNYVANGVIGDSTWGPYILEGFGRYNTHIINNYGGTEQLWLPSGSVMRALGYQAHATITGYAIKGVGTDSRLLIEDCRLFTSEDDFVDGGHLLQYDSWAVVIRDSTLATTADNRCITHGGPEGIITGNVFESGAAIYVESLIGTDELFVVGNMDLGGQEFIEVAAGQTGKVIERANYYSGTIIGGSASIEPGTRDTDQFSQAGVLSVGAGSFRLPVVDVRRVLKVRAMVGTAPVGASVTIDINKNGSTIFTTQGNRPTIASGQNDSGTAVPDITDLAPGDYVTVDIDTVGAPGTEGEDLVVTLVTD